ncbi:MAG: hypothetical protein V4590_00615 [Bacteroidota bacterium]
MKITKHFFPLIIAVLLTLTINACKDCDDEDPRAKIINNGAQKASVQIKTSGGNTVNINNVDPGTASPNASYASGIVMFTIKVNNIDYSTIVEMYNCHDYEIAIDANNVITTKSVDRND